jgi:Neuraminidase (sialidase)
MVYVLWGDEREGNLDVWFSRSADKGETWSEAIRVNDDSTQADQFLPWLTVDPETGHLYSVFYDRRHDENGSSNHVYLAWSKDAGQTWVNERLTESSFETNEKIFMGDYNNISAYNGMVRPIWVEFRNGRKELWTALIQNVH